MLDLKTNLYLYNFLRVSVLKVVSTDFFVSVYKYKRTSCKLSYNFSLNKSSKSFKYYSSSLRAKKIGPPCRCINTGIERPFGNFLMIS